MFTITMNFPINFEMEGSFYIGQIYLQVLLFIFFLKNPTHLMTILSNEHCFLIQLEVTNDQFQTTTISMIIHYNTWNRK